MDWVCDGVGITVQPSPILSEVQRNFFQITIFREHSSIGKLVFKVLLERNELNVFSSKKQNSLIRG
jgi:hypothetical protein